ncbi:hypothetical protein [Azohydromonas aeria]|uniref:hypothetical protein n=1 Tax=Azohydromonas aeria TaxID=2590212 RepID=UPI0012F888D1|nr:hypothetical protein [Azohydromonas aeria]
MPMKPVVQLRPGDQIRARFLLDKARVAHWKYGAEAPPHFSIVAAGAVLRIFEVHAVMPYWVKAWLPHTHETAWLKIAGEELAMNFDFVAA